MDQGSSRNFILGGEAHRSHGVRSWRGEGRLHNSNYWQYLGGGGGGGGSWVSLGGKLSCLGGGGGGASPVPPPPPPSLDETLRRDVQGFAESRARRPKTGSSFGRSSIVVGN